MSFTDEEVRNMLKNGLDGCILAAYTPAVEDILARKIPTVLALENMHEQIGRRASCVSVLMDNREIGRIAAEHFKSLGRFASYAFIPAPPKIPWSLERKAHALEGISTSDVIAKLHVSRALLNLRFRQLRHESVMDAILAIRLDAVRKRLKATYKTLLAIGAECGFRNPDYLKRLFRKRFGMSMREWRTDSRPTRCP